MLWFMLQCDKSWDWNMSGWNCHGDWWGVRGREIQDFKTCAKLTDVTSIQSSSVRVCFSGYAVDILRETASPAVLGSWPCCPYPQPCWPLRPSCTGALLFALGGCQVLTQLLWAHLASPIFPCECDGSGQRGTPGCLSVGFFWSVFTWKGLERCWVKSVKLLKGLRQLVGWTLGEISGSDFFNLHWLSRPHVVGEGTVYCLVLRIVSLWFVDPNMFPLGAVDQRNRLKFVGRIFTGLSSTPLRNTVFVLRWSVHV